jgi:hypothetical protein
MNLISGTHNFCERREYAFNVLPEYLIITLLISCLQRADNPSLPLTFASRRRLGLESDQTSVFRMVPQFFSLIFNTIHYI